MRIVITKQGWFGQKFQASIITKDGLTFKSEIVPNLSKLEDAVKQLQRDFNKYIIFYDNIIGD